MIDHCIVQHDVSCACWSCQSDWASGHLPSPSLDLSGKQEAENKAARFADNRESLIRHDTLFDMKVFSHLLNCIPSSLPSSPRSRFLFSWYLCPAPVPKMQ